MNVRCTFGFAYLILFTSFVGSAQAGLVITSDFNNGTGDTGFDRYDPLVNFGAGGTWNFPNDAYQIMAAPSPNPVALGPGRAGSSVSGTFADVKLNWDIVDWDDNLDQVFGGFVRLNEIGLGTLDGYYFSYYNDTDDDNELVLSRLENEVNVTLDFVTLELDAAKDYRFELTAVGDDLTGTVFDLDDLTTALATVTATDSTYAAGQPGLGVINWSDLFNGSADATFDNFRAEVVPEPTSLTLWVISLTGIAVGCRKRIKAVR